MKISAMQKRLAEILESHGDLDVCELRGCATIDIERIYVAGFQRNRLDDTRPEGLPVVWLLS